MSVHSNDGITGLTKLNRIGELSTQHQEMVFNNIGHLISVDMLKEQYQQLDGKKAVGIDKVTKEDYEENLDQNLMRLIKRIRRGTYQPRPARITEIPKEDGGSRPLAIACFEDKLVQLAVSTILNKIYEPLFLSSSYGFRPGRSCHDALRALTKSVFPNLRGALVEIDLRKCFNVIPHSELMKILRNKISDRRFLRLIEVLITAPIMEGNQPTRNDSGCPQGSIVSPILSNIYLHHVIDEWFETIRHTHIRGRAEEIRYADDMVFTFEHKEEAQRFYQVLPKRLAKYGLALHPEKSQVIPAGYLCAKQAHTKGERLPTFKFLGFIGYWAKARKGFWRLKYKSRPDRMTAKLKGLRKFLWENLNVKDTHALLDTVIRVVRGWMNYHNISDNAHMIEAFRKQCMRILFKWYNRRGRKRPLSWKRFNIIMESKGFPRAGKTISMFQAH